MAKLRHIAIQVPDPQKAAEFYMRVFGMRKVGETDWENARGVYLTDGVMNLALLDYKTEYAAGERGCNFVGLHHIGFWVDDVAKTRSAMEASGAKHWMGEPAEGGLDLGRGRGRRDAEDGIVVTGSAHRRESYSPERQPDGAAGDRRGTCAGSS